MVDFRAQPIPASLLQEIVKTRAQSGLGGALNAGVSGFEQGLALTDQIAKVKDAQVERQRQAKVRDLIDNIVGTDEFKSANEESGGMLEAVFQQDPVKGFDIWTDIKKSKATAEQKSADRKARASYWASSLNGRGTDELNKTIANATEMMQTASKFETGLTMGEEKSKALFEEAQIQYQAAMAEKLKRQGVKIETKDLTALSDDELAKEVIAGTPGAVEEGKKRMASKKSK